MKRHNTNQYYVVGEGIFAYNSRKEASCIRPSTKEELTSFRFSRLGPRGAGLGEATRVSLAEAMTANVNQQDDNEVPAGFTYLAQFIDHDLTLDASNAALRTPVTVDQLVQGRSPALDLDALYGLGPHVQPEFYADGIRLKTGTTAPVNLPVNLADPLTSRVHPGFDLPRVGVGPRKRDRRAAQIPDLRNDENLALGQTHMAFIRFHNRVVDLLSQTTPSVDLFTRAHESVVRHYQWMVRTDFLPRIVDPAVVEDVFTNGRKYFEVPPAYDADLEVIQSYMSLKNGDTPTIPIEFSVAAYRLGHSMVRRTYQWNRLFRDGGSIAPATLARLFQFSGTSGNLSPDSPEAEIADPDSGSFEVLPSIWIADFRRLYDFREAGRLDLVAPGDELNVVKRIDTLLVDPLRNLPPGSFDGRDRVPPPTPPELNLAFRNLTRAEMVELATGVQMAEKFGVPMLSEDQILTGNGGADLSGLGQAEQEAVVKNPPLWFYILREAELASGKLTGVGARIVAEVFHRAIEGSRISIVRDYTWRPNLGPDSNTFRMTDLLLTAFEGRADLLNPLGD